MVAGPDSCCVVFELGTEKGAPHFHYYLKCRKSRPTVVKCLQRLFFLPTDRAQRYSMKVVVPGKLDRYFLYLAKGMTGKAQDPVEVLYDSEPRMWPLLHDQFHKNAEEPEGEPGRAVPKGEAFWVEWADKLRAEGKTSKDDVLESVTCFYVYESRKGFDRFLVVRSFWRLYALVSADDAHQAMLESCKQSLSV